MRGISIDAQEKVCRGCGKSFATHANGRTHCSYECQQAAHVEKRRQRRRDALEALISTCPVCAKRFPQGGMRNRLYCTDRCNKKAWKIRHRERYLAASLALGNKKKLGGNYLRALERDEGKCRQCGTPSVLVHHLDNRGEKCTIISQNHALENLVTLCPPCHRALHRLDWAFDGEALVISSEAFKAFLGTATIRVPAKVVMPYDA